MMVSVQEGNTFTALCKNVLNERIKSAQRVSSEEPEVGGEEVSGSYHY